MWKEDDGKVSETKGGEMVCLEVLEEEVECKVRVYDSAAVL